MESPYCRDAADLQAAVLAILTGGNGGMWTAQQTYGVSAQWGQDGMITITGTMAITRNAEALLVESVDPQITTTQTETRPEVITTSSETRPQSVETSVTTQLASVTTQVDEGRTDTDSVNQGPSATTVTTLGSDNTTDTNVWYSPIDDDYYTQP